MTDDTGRLQTRALAILIAVAALLAGVLLWGQMASGVVAQAAAIRLAKTVEIGLIDYHSFPACQKTDRFAELESRLERAIELDPGNQAAWQNLVKVRWAAGDCAGVEQLLASRSIRDDQFLELIQALLDIQAERFKGRESYPHAAEIGRLLTETGEDADEAGLVDQSAQWYYASFWLDPNLETAEWLVSYYTTRADMPHLNWVWEYLAEEKAGSDDGWWAKFHQAELPEDLEGKIAALEAGAESSTDPYQFLIDLGQVYWREKLYSDAIIAYEKAEELDETVVWPVISQGQVYLEIGDLEKAKERLKLAISRDPGNPFGYFILGVAYDRMGDLAAAIAQTQKAVEVALQSGVNPWTMSEVLGHFYVKAGQCVDARVAYEQALEWQPDEPRLVEALRSLAFCSNK